MSELKLTTNKENKENNAKLNLNPDTIKIIFSEAVKNIQIEFQGQEYVVDVERLYKLLSRRKVIKRK